VGGILADMMGYREIFFITALLCFVSGFVIIRFVRDVPQPAYDQTKPSVIQNVKFMFTNHHLRIIAIVIVLSQIAALMIEPLFALFIESFKTSTKYISTLTGFTIAISGVFMVISSPWWGKRNDRFGFKKNIIYALTGTGITYSLHMIVPNLFSLIFLRAGMGFVRGGILHALYSMTNLYSPDNRKSGMIGIASSLTVLGNMIGPLLGGWVAGNWGIQSVFIFNSFLFLICAAIIWFYYFEIKHQAKSESDAVNILNTAE